MQSEQPKKLKNWDWRADLAAARDVEHRGREGYRGFLEWFENFLGSFFRVRPLIATICSVY